VLQQGRNELYKDARAMGLSKQAAWALVNQLLKIPPVNAKVTIVGIQRAITQVGALRYEIDRLHGKVVNVTVKSNTLHGSTASAQRWGGLYQHADVGVLREAGTYPAVTRGARYAFAEPATRGEAFIPKSGNYGRSMAILSAAAGWYGASVVPARRGGGAEYTHRIIIEGTGVIAGLRREIYIGANGNVQTYLGKGRG
jgi:hypothetical protein